MNTKLQSGYRLLDLLIMAMVAAVLAMLVMPAKAQVENTTLTLGTNTPPTVTGSAAATTGANFVPVWQGRGMAVSAKFNANSGTAPGYVWVYSSVDGTNSSTAPFAMLTLTPNGTTDQVVNTNWSAAQLTGYRFLNFSTWSNSAAGSVYLTNKALLISRPNSS
ncbi:MAG TPA: hypothetical protein VG167_00935 [Verrucomicrobiae bacterium]|nr:hypothetical protein [Verrucomicrobiae bacterium]